LAGVLSQCAALGLILIWFGAIQKKNLCMAIGVCYLMLVSMNLVILFTKGGHWVLWK